MSSECVRVDCVIADNKLNFLVDSGASHNFISLQTCRQLGVQSRSGHNVRVRLADGSILRTSQFVSLLVKFNGGKSVLLHFTVLDASCPNILGMPFLRATNPQIDWVNRTICFPDTPACKNTLMQSNPFHALTLEPSANAQNSAESVYRLGAWQVPIPCADTAPAYRPHGVIAGAQSVEVSSPNCNVCAPVCTKTHNRSSRPPFDISRSERCRVSFDPVAVAIDECKQYGGFTRVFEVALRAKQLGRTLSRVYCSQCENPVFDTHVRDSTSPTRVCQNPKCGLELQVPTSVVANPLAEFLKSTRVGQDLAKRDLNLANLNSFHPAKPNETSPMEKSQDQLPSAFSNLVQQRVEDFEETSFKNWLRDLKRDQYSEAFFCWSHQIMDADCAPSSELLPITEHADAMSHVESACASSMQSLHYTHRTAHGRHGLGDKTTLQELSSETLQELKRDFPNVFSEPRFPVDRPESQQHHIRLKDPSKDPPCKKLYALDKVELEALKEQLQTLLDSGRIVHSSSPYGAPILFARKKDSDKLRMCIDYRALNANTILDRYPLPRIDNLLSQLHGAKVFSKLDLRDGYHQVPMSTSDQFKTAFCTRYGQFEFTVMPFGLCNAPATFQRLMNQTFFDLLDKCVLIYLDDILIFSRDVTSHKQHLRHVFNCLDKCNLHLKESKCSLFLENVEFLGHTISANGVTVEQGKVTAVTEWPTPKNLNEVQQFLGLCNYYRRFICGFAKHAAPLTMLTKKNVPFQWLAPQQSAFDCLKECLTSAPVLCVFDAQRPTRVSADASTTCVGAVLEQYCEDSQWHPCEFFSKRLNSAQCNYSATEREMLGVILALERWRCHLIGIEFECITDHASLVYLHTQEKLSRRQAKWVDFLAQFKFVFKHVPGRQHVVADTMSRVPDSAEQRLINVISLSDESHLISVVKRVQCEFAHDDWFQKMYQRATEHPGEYAVRNEILCKLVNDYYAPVIPPTAHDMKHVILAELHASALGGHLSLDKMYPQLRTRFYWPGMHKDCKRFCKECTTCQQSRTSTQQPTGLLQPHEVPTKPFQHFSLDFITSLPVTSRGHDAILTIVDRFSKLCVLVPCTTTVDAETTARLFFDNVVCKYGMPEKIISDRDTRFDSLFWRSLMKMMQCRINMSTAYHPQTDGQTERFNRSVEQVLRCFCSPRQDDWDLFLQQVAFSLNSTVHKGTRVSAFACIFGFQPQLPLDHALSALHDNKVQAVDNLVKTRSEIQCDVHNALQRYNAAMQRSADRHRRDSNFSIGDTVYLSASNLRLHPAINRKLAPRWIGPYKIVEQISPVAFKLQLPTEYKQLHPVFHASQLKLHQGPVPQPRSPVPIDTSDDPEYEVERIIAKRIVKNNVEYLVQWKGYNVHDATWEPQQHVRNAPQAVADFEAQGVRTRKQR